MTKREIIDFKKFIRKDLLNKGLKQCPKCNLIKTLEKFAPKNSSNDGRQCFCYECQKSYVKKSHHKAVLNVSNDYVKRYACALLKISRETLSPEILGVVRQQILTNRKLKQIKHEKTIK